MKNKQNQTLDPGIGPPIKQERREQREELTTRENE